MDTENINKSLIDSDEISLKELILKLHEIFKYLLSKWFIVLVCGFLGGALGLVYTHFKKTTYTASTTFVLEDEKSSGGLGSLAGLASMAGIDLGSSGGGIFQGDNILALYRSRTMIERTLLTEADLGGKKQLLIDRYIDFNQLRKGWTDKPELRDINFKNTQSTKLKSETNSSLTRLQDSIMSIVIKDINKIYLNATKPDKKLSIINVSVNAKDENFAKAFNDAIVQNVNDFYVQTKTKKALLNVDILQHKTDSVRAVMNGSIYKAAAVADATPNLNPTKQVQRIAPVQEAQFSAETNKAVLGELVKNLEMSKLSLLKETPLIQVLDRPVFPLESDVVSKPKAITFGALLSCMVGIFVLVSFKTYKNIISD